MRELISDYIQFPVAIESPDGPDWQEQNFEVMEWFRSMDISYNRDFIGILARPKGSSFRSKALSGYAFKNRHHALQFKIAFAGT